MIFAMMMLRAALGSVGGAQLRARLLKGPVGIFSAWRQQA